MDQRRNEEPGEPDREPGSALEPHRPSPPPADWDPEQVRRFEEFRRFQEFQRFQEQHGGDPTAGFTGERAPERTKRPVWLRLLGNKYARRAVYLAVVIAAAMIAYEVNFGGGDDDRPASETGGGTYRTNQILSTKPYEAVRGVYDAIAQEDPATGQPPVPQACGRFREDVQQVFAVNMGYPDCRAAVLALHEQVDSVNAYAESMPSSGFEQPLGDTMTVSSCDFAVVGGPRLGRFTLTQVEKGQWLITGHQTEPDPCPKPKPTPSR